MHRESIFEALKAVSHLMHGTLRSIQESTREDWVSSESNLEG